MNVGMVRMSIRRKPSHTLGHSHLHPLQFGQSLQNRQRREVAPTKHYKVGGNAV